MLSLSRIPWQVMKNRAMNEGRCLKGRQIVFLMEQFFRTHAHLGCMYSIMDLTELPFRGDADLPNFRYLWDTIMDRMRDRLEDKTLENYWCKS